MHLSCKGINNAWGLSSNLPHHPLPGNGPPGFFIQHATPYQQTYSLFLRRLLSIRVLIVWQSSQSVARLLVEVLPPYISAQIWSTSSCLVLPQMMQRFSSLARIFLFMLPDTSRSYLTRPQSKTPTFSLAWRKYLVILLDLSVDVRALAGVS